MLFSYIIYIYSYYTMSKFNSTSSFFKRNNTQQLNITTKVSQKELKKNKKLEKNNANNSISNVSANDFDKLMEENDNPKNTTKNSNTNKTQVKMSSYLDKIIDSEILSQLIKEGIKGENLVNRIKYENVSGSQLFKTILKKYSDPNNCDWVKKEEYGDALINLIEDNFEEQLLCLVVIQNHCIQMNMPKISYKDKDMYYIKLIFQLLFTQDIIDESVYWKWYELLSTFADISEDTKNKLLIQTTEFFNILKITFTDEDYEPKENDDNNDENNKNDNNNKNEQRLEQESESESEQESEDKYKVPEEQDWNLDDI